MAATDTMVRVTETASERRFMARMAEQAGRFSDMVLQEIIQRKNFMYLVAFHPVTASSNG